MAIGDNREVRVLAGAFGCRLRGRFGLTEFVSQEVADRIYFLIGFRERLAVVLPCRYEVNTVRFCGIPVVSQFYEEWAWR